MLSGLFPAEREISKHAKNICSTLLTCKNGSIFILHEKVVIFSRVAPDSLTIFEITMIIHASSGCVRFSFFCSWSCSTTKCDHSKMLLLPGWLALMRRRLGI